MFATASAVTRLGDGLYEASFDPSWFQGPGVYGGLSAAVLLRAMGDAVGGRPPRTLSMQYCAPVTAGPARIEVRVERAGTMVSFVSARLLQQERVQVHGVATFGLARTRDFDVDELVPPVVPRADEVPVTPYLGALLPTFLKNFELRFALGGLPYTGGAEAVVGAWLRSVEPEPVDAALAVALLDVLPPAILVRATSLRPMTTLALHYHLLEPLPRHDLDPARPLFCDVRSSVTRDGYSDEEARLFAPDGRVLALARQLVAVIR